MSLNAVHPIHSTKAALTTEPTIWSVVVKAIFARAGASRPSQYGAQVKAAIKDNARRGGT